MSEEQQCQECGHIIKGDELRKRQYYSMWNATDPDHLQRCTKCQRAADEERARYSEHMPEPNPDEVSEGAGDDVGSASAQRGGRGGYRG